MRNALLLLIGLFATVLFSCTPTQPAMKTQEELLAGTTDKTWTMTNLINTRGMDVTTQYKIYTFTFKRNGSMVYTRQFTTSSEPSITEGSWEMKDSSLTLIISGGRNLQKINQLSENGLIFSATDSQTKTTLKPQ